MGDVVSARRDRTAFKKSAFVVRTVMYVYHDKDTEYEFKSRDEIEEEKRVTARSSMKIIDMRGSTSRVIEDMTELKQKKETLPNRLGLVEMIHNTQKLADQSANNVEYATNRSVDISKSLPKLRKQIERGTETLLEKQKMTERLQQVVAIVRNMQNQLDGLLESSAFDDMGRPSRRAGQRSMMSPKHAEELLNGPIYDNLKSLVVDYPDEYRSFSLYRLTFIMLIPLFKLCYTQWVCVMLYDVIIQVPLSAPSRGIDILVRYRELLTAVPVPLSSIHMNNDGQVMRPDSPIDDDYAASSMSSVDPKPDVFTALLSACVLPALRSSFSQWNPTRDVDEAVDVIDSWSAVFPDKYLEAVINNVVLTRLSAAVSAWDPGSDPIPIHTWIHPWLHFLPESNQVFDSILDKMMQALSGWQVSDRSAHEMLLPWRSVLNSRALDTLSMTSLLPKLESAMALVKTGGAVLQNVLDVVLWGDIIDAEYVSSILSRHFFSYYFKTLNAMDTIESIRSLCELYNAMPAQLRCFVTVHSHLEDCMLLIEKKLLTSRAPNDVLSSLVSVRKSIDDDDNHLVHPHLNTMPAPAAVRPQTSKPSIDPEDISWKDTVEYLAEASDLVLMPTNKTVNGKQVYSLGKLIVYLDELLMYVNVNKLWVPMAVEEAIDRAR